MGYTAFKRVCITRLPTSITVSLTDLHPIVRSVVSRCVFFCFFYPAQLVFPSLLFFVKDEIFGRYPYGQVSLSVTQTEYGTVGKYHFSFCCSKTLPVLKERKQLRNVRGEE